MRKMTKKAIGICLSALIFLSSNVGCDLLPNFGKEDNTVEHLDIYDLAVESGFEG